MIAIPALDTNGEKVGTCTFIEPKDYLHFYLAHVGQQDFDAVKAMPEAQMAGEVEDGLANPRLDSLRLSYEMFENKLETVDPLWWKTSPPEIKGAVLADLFLKLVPKWVLKEPNEFRDKVVLYPIEEMHRIVHLLAFGDRRIRKTLTQWDNYWRQETR